MQINRKDVLGVDNIYTSALFKDYYAVDFYVRHHGQVVKMRYPFSTMERAEQMMDYLQGKTNVQPNLDYRREVWYLSEKAPQPNTVDNTLKIPGMLEMDGILPRPNNRGPYVVQFRENINGEMRQMRYPYTSQARAKRLINQVISDYMGPYSVLPKKQKTR